MASGWSRTTQPTSKRESKLNHTNTQRKKNHTRILPLVRICSCLILLQMLNTFAKCMRCSAYQLCSRNNTGFVPVPLFRRTLSAGLCAVLCCAATSATDWRLAQPSMQGLQLLKYLEDQVQCSNAQRQHNGIVHRVVLLLKKLRPQQQQQNSGVDGSSSSCKQWRPRWLSVQSTRDADTMQCIRSRLVGKQWVCVACDLMAAN